MKIKIKQLGGFAGIEKTLATAESDRLLKVSADEVRKHVEALTALTAQKPQSIGADQFRYEIEITEPGAAPRTISVIDDGDPAQPLMKHVAGLLELTKASG